MSADERRAERQAQVARLRRALDENPTVSFRQVCADVGINYRTAYRYVGAQGWRLVQRPGREPVSKEVCIAALQKAAAELGHSPTSRDFYTGRGVGHMTIYKSFGTWDAALEAAGLEPIRWQAEGLPAKMRLTQADLKDLGVVSA